MTRIIAGTAGGRRLLTPAGTATRPTSDRVREALFSTVQSVCGPLDGLRVLDLYAGSGAVGLEAWSRGAGVVTLVEHDRRTAAVVARNIAQLAARRANVVTGSVGHVLRTPPAAPYDVVFSDPPYPMSDELVAADLDALVSHDWLVPDGLVVVERSVRSPEPGWPPGLVGLRSKRYGETCLWYGRATPEGPETGRSATDTDA